MIRIILLVMALLSVNKIAHAQVYQQCCANGVCGISTNCPAISGAVSSFTTTTGGGVMTCCYAPPPRYSDLIITGKAGLLRYQTIKEKDCAVAAEALKQSSDVTDAKCLDRVK